MLYKDDKCVNDTVGPSEGGPAEAGDLLTQSLHLLDNVGWWQSQRHINALGLVPWAQYLSLPTRQDSAQGQ